MIILRLERYISKGNNFEVVRFGGSFKFAGIHPSMLVMEAR